MESETKSYIRNSQISLASISCFLDLLIIIFFIRAKIKKKATIGFEFILYLSLCNLIKEIAYTINWEENPEYKIQRNTSNLIYNKTNYLLETNEDFSLNYKNNTWIGLLDRQGIINGQEMINNLQNKIIYKNFLSNEVDDNEKNIKHTSSVCLIQGLLMIHSDISHYAVASVISLYTYISINEFSNILNIPKRLFLYLIGYIFPFSLGLFSMLTNKIDKNVHWCWIRKGETDFIYLNYILVWFFIFLNFVISFKILRYKYNSYWDKDQAKNNKVFGKKIIAYPLISVIFWFVYSINRVLQDYSNNSIYSFSIFIIYLNNIEGIIYASIAVYGIKIHKKINRQLNKFMNSFKKKSDDINRTSEIRYDDLLNDTKSKFDVAEDRPLSFCKN